MMNAATASPDHTRLEESARRFAAIPAASAEPMIDAYVAHAIAEWRIADATFWQRVKFRARLHRAAHRLTR